MTAASEPGSGADERPETRVTTFTVDNHHVAIISFPIGLSEDAQATLTESERAVCVGLLHGAQTRDIAETRACAAGTVKNQMRSAYKKLRVQSRWELIARYTATTPRTFQTYGHVSTDDVAQVIRSQFDRDAMASAPKTEVPRSLDG